MSATRPQIPPEFIAAHKRRRMIDAMAELCAEQGYEATKIADVVRRAHVARKTLYDNFSGKEELFLATFDLALTEAEAQIAAACEPLADEAWEVRTEAGLRALLEFIAAHPAEAKLCLVEAPAAGPEAAARYEAALEGFIARLRAAAPARPGRPATLEDALVGGTVWILQREARRDAAHTATDLLPELASFVTSPYRDVGKR
ncbi:MAG TPA: helix-turn-helix domain-containing protein [Solirubrobacterales bacterium]|nr:helix-turn-helix domain-containing protein [Solirubrobacterales bacterium]